MSSPPRMKPVLSTPQSRPHAWTDTSDNPYASRSDMNTPPRKLLNVANMISAVSPGTSPTTRMVPRRSTARVGATTGASEVPTAAAARSGTGTSARCTMATVRTANARISTQNMPPAATSTPLITEVVRNDTPDVVPTSPFARSLVSSSISAVTSVGRAMVRMLPAMTPNIDSTMSVHSATLPGSVNDSCGVTWYTPNAAAYSRNDTAADTCM